ncbi:MAG TPA: DUF1566 domain-containing protein [Candidatus Limnocylindrales bacterium]|nr:DUF1566 domain-containing protein [Candidatus Limnocylindrales bacterium]
MRISPVVPVAITISLALLAVPPVAGARTAQEKCDQARLKAWSDFVKCQNAVLAKPGTGYMPRTIATLKCRRKYFAVWEKFQSDGGLAGTTCQPSGGARFVDNGDQTVTDNLTLLVWEKKDSLDNSADFGNPHDADNAYSISATSKLDLEDGTAYSDFLSALNESPGFAGALGWRVPTLIELQTIVLEFACAKSASDTGDPGCDCADPCIDSIFGPTKSVYYKTSTRNLNESDQVWAISFEYSDLNPGAASNLNDGVRAVRGGL